MAATVTTSGTFPTVPWDDEASVELGNVAADTICHRAFDLGLDVNDQPFPPLEGGGASKLGGRGPLRDGIRQSVVVLGPGRVAIRPTGKLGAIVEGLSKKRRFLGFSPRDLVAIQRAMPGIVERAIARHAVTQ